MMMVDVPYPTTPIAELAVRFVADDELTDRKLAALRSQVSQVEPLVQQAGVDVYRELLRGRVLPGAHRRRLARA